MDQTSIPNIPTIKGWSRATLTVLCGGLVGGLLCQWRPKLAQHPVTGFCLTFGVSRLRGGLLFFLAPDSRGVLARVEDLGLASVLQGLGTALILAIVEQVRDRDEQRVLKH